MQHLIEIYHVFQEWCAFSLRLDLRKQCSAKPYHRCLNQWLDNVNINNYANMPFGSRVMSIFITWPRSTRLILSKAPVCKKRLLHMQVVRQWWHACVCKFDHVQELWAFSLTANSWADRATTCIVHTSVRAICIYQQNVMINEVAIIYEGHFESS